MLNLVVYILLFSIYTNILFFENANGLNWLLYSIPLLILSIVVLAKNKKIKKKSGLLFIIPILILSASIFLYNNVFTKLNVVIIPILFLMMYVYTVRPTFRLKELLLDLIRLIFKKFYPTYLRNFTNLVSLKIKKLRVKKEFKKRLLSVIIVIPIVLIIMALLVTADMQFKNLFGFIFDSFKDFSILKLFIRIVLITIMFIFFGSFLNYLSYGYPNEDRPEESKFRIEPFTIKLLLVVLNVIYIVFDVIQVQSLFLHQVGSGIVYSEYARTGFFQLMFVSVINIGILLISKRSKKECLSIKNLSALMVALTAVIICSSFFRMYMYDTAYGYTVLRLIVYATLITEAVLLIPTLFYIYNSKVKILKHYLIICLFAYTLMNVYSIDKIIAKNNIDRYDRTNKIDVVYLAVDLSYDDIPELVEFYSKVDDETIKSDIKDLVCDKYADEDRSIVYKWLYREDKNIFEYNYSRNKAYKLFDKFECNKK